MTDRDHFAAAALTGLLHHNHEPPKPVGWWVEQAYDYADAMLRERGRADRDNCVTGNNPEMPCPVTEPLPKEKRAEVSDSEPVAWGVMIEGSRRRDRSGAQISYAINIIRDIYRKCKNVPATKSGAATLRGLLERLK